VSDKLASMRDAVAELVRDGDTLAIEGFTTPSRCLKRATVRGSSPWRWG
jgi:acyl CoA:acetate/3-ketoacid CoA transferase alpha subunit